MAVKPSESVREREARGEAGRVTGGHTGNTVLAIFCCQ